MKLIAAVLFLLSCSACSWLLDCVVETSLNNQSARKGGPSLFHGDSSEAPEEKKP